VLFDSEVTSVEKLSRWVEECGYQCAGQSAPGHVCDPLVDVDHGPHDHAAVERADEADGHGEVGFLLIVIAGVWLVAAQIPQLKLRTARTIVAGVLLAIAGLLLIIATHWGQFG
jgi:hypothetical protein